MDDVARYTGQRVLLTCRSNFSYVGTLKELASSGGAEVVLLELDEVSHFAVMCPTSFVAAIRPLGDAS